MYKNKVTIMINFKNLNLHKILLAQNSRAFSSSFCQKSTNNHINLNYSERFMKFFKRNYSDFSIPKIEPVKTYENADTQKLQILNENKNKSGIY